MLFSLITAVYNNEQFIENCIKSVLEQTFTNYEYIIIDGKSTDNSISIIQKYNSKITRIISEPDSGMYDALNKGVKLAAGDIIGFIHSDDFYTDNMVLEKVNEAFETKNIDAVYGDLQYVSKTNTDNVIRNWQSKNFQPGMLQKGWMPPHPTLFVRKKFHEQLKGFNLKYNIAADYDWMLRFFSLPDIHTYYLNKTLIKMRWGGKSNKSVLNIIKKMYEDYLTLKRNKIGGLYTLYLKNFQKLNQLF
ncbi:MAG: glycosyltransferase [Chlorobi bacterium]|nr:glycosyltransferase [Chlorobiota bacterium]